MSGPPLSSRAIAERCCTWCGHDDHSAGCPATIATDAIVGVHLERFITTKAADRETIPCPCTKGTNK